MAIEYVYLQLLKHAIERRRATRPRMQGLLLAYPDLLVPRAKLVQVFGEDLLAKLPTRADSPAIWSYHGLDGVQDPIFDSAALLRSLGVEPTIIDVAKLRGDERIVDLNHPLPQDLVASFDLVVDTGTCEHCFNVGQAFANACQALAAGGMLVHAAPLARANHGFWNFNPTVYPDFFEDNGFRLHALTGVSGNLRDGMRAFAIEPFARTPLPAESVVYVVAERVEVRETRWPVQRKYRGMIG